MPSIRYLVLGPVEVRRDGEPVALRRAKDRALLAALLVQPGSLARTASLAQALWGNDGPASVTSSLQACASNLRRVVGAERLEGRRGGYVLQVGAGELDAAEFEQLLEAARRSLDRGDPEGALSDVGRALTLWRGPAFGEFADAEFARLEALRLEEMRLGATEIRLEALIELGRHTQAAAELQSLLREHPLRERFRALHMLALYRAGRQADALASYREHRTLLVGELGVDPAPELQRLERQILEQDRSLDRPTPRTPGPARVPVPPTELIGRGNELRSVAKQLAEHRLVSVTGPGGAGKTRLAIEVAHHHAGAFDDVWFVELTQIRNERLLRGAIASALEVRERPGGGGLPDALASILVGRRALLVLDNCEQVLEGAAEVANELLEAAPGLSVLTTSRERLRVPGEVVVTVPPLELPADDLGDPRSAASYPAVRLFTERVLEVRPDLEVTDEAARLCVAICRRLDALPLAIELAAAQARVMPLEEIAASIEARLTVSDAEREHERQRSLRAAIAWSYELLLDTERRALRRLAVFAGGCELPAARVVIGDEPLNERDVPRMLWSLVDRSMVTSHSTWSRARYGMLETIREYAAEHLEASGEGGIVRRRHFNWVGEMVSSAARAIGGPDEAEALALLAREHHNVRAALETGFADGEETPHAVALCSSLAVYWNVGGHLREGLDWLRRAIAAAPSDDARAQIRLHAAGFLAQLGEFEEAEGMVAESVRVVDETGDRRLRAGAEQQGAVVALFAGRMDEAKAGADAGYRLYSEVGDEVQATACLVLRGVAERLTGEYGAARRSLEQAAEIARRRGDSRQLATALANLGAVTTVQGDYEHALALLRDAIDLGETLNAVQLLVPAYGSLGNALFNLGRLGDAELAYERSAELARRSGEVPAMLATLANLANVRRMQGRLQEALAAADEAVERARAANIGMAEQGALQIASSVLREQGRLREALTRQVEALRLRADLKLRRGIAESFDMVGILLADLGEVPRAACVLAAGQSVRDETGAAREPEGIRAYERALAEARSRDPKAFEHGWERGARLSSEQAIRLALQYAHEALDERE